MSATTIDFQAICPDEVVTDALVRDIELPGAAGTMALVTLDNGKDHTRPNTFGPQTLMRLAEVLDGVKARVDAGELASVAITGKPFILAAGADLSGVAKVTDLSLIHISCPLPCSLMILARRELKQQ